MSQPLPLLTARLEIRRFRLDDASRVFALSQQQGMRQWLPDQVYQDLHEATDVLTALIRHSTSPKTPTRAPLVLGLSLRETGRLIGHMGLSPTKTGVEVGYAIDESDQGQGLASEALGALTPWAFREFGLVTIEAIVASQNKASCRVLEKCGFTLFNEVEGTLHGEKRLVRTYRTEPGPLVSDGC